MCRFMNISKSNFFADYNTKVVIVIEMASARDLVHNGTWKKFEIGISDSTYEYCLF